MSRTMTHLGAVCALSALILATTVSAGGSRHKPPKPPVPTTYDFTVIDLPVLSGDPRRFIILDALADDGTIAGIDNTLGGLSSRIAPDLTVTPITCPTDQFPRYPFASTGGPTVRAMNNLLTVVGDDEGVDGSGNAQTYGFEQTADGTCTFTLVPGSVGTMFTNIADTGTIVGDFFDPTGGLTAIHGFVKQGGTITPLDAQGLPPNTVLMPTSRNAVGDTLITGFLNVQPDNSYVYQMLLRFTDGTVRELDGPDGQDIGCTDLNNLGQATCFSMQDSSGAWIYDSVTDTFTDFPDPTALTVSVLLTGLNDLGQVIGRYGEIDPNCPQAPFCTETSHQFLATPQAPPPPPKHRHARGWWHKKRQHCPRLKDVRDAKEARTQRQSNQPRPQDMVFMPAIDEDGTVVLVRGDGTQVRGRRH
jgi:hypothetical protein